MSVYLIEKYSLTCSFAILCWLILDGEGHIFKFKICLKLEMLRSINADGKSLQGVWIPAPSTSHSEVFELALALFPAGHGALYYLDLWCFSDVCTQSDHSSSIRGGERCCCTSLLFPARPHGNASSLCSPGSQITLVQEVQHFPFLD